MPNTDTVDLTKVTRIENGIGYNAAGKNMGPVPEPTDTAAPSQPAAPDQSVQAAGSVPFDPSKPYEEEKPPVQQAGSIPFDPNKPYEEEKAAAKPTPTAAPALSPLEQGQGRATGIGPRHPEMPQMDIPVPTAMGTITIPGKGVVAFHNWLEDALADWHSGTESTWVGSVMKKLGAKGTQYGVAPGVEKIMPGVSAVSGGLQALEAAPLAVEGHSVKAVNKAVAGAFEAIGPLAMVRQPAALAVVVPAMGAQNAMERAAKAMGLDDDYAELAGNVAGVMVGAKVHSTLEMEEFQNALKNANDSRQHAISRATALDDASRRVQALTERKAPTADIAAAESAVEEAQKVHDTAMQEHAEADLRLKKFNSDLQQRIEDMNKRKEAIRTTADALGNYVKVVLTRGRAPDFMEAIRRGMKISSKNATDLLARAADVEDDLMEIFNKNADKMDNTPGSVADAIDRHLQSNIDAPLQAEAGATKGSPDPVVANFSQRLEERLDKFFEDNAGKFGGADDVASAKERILNRVKMENDQGGGLKTPRDPNLYESENIRQGFNQESKIVQGEDVTNLRANAYKAAAKEAGQFMKEIIDEAYENRGVKGVKEAREAESKLIDVAKAFRDSQSLIDKLGPLKSLANTLSFHTKWGAVAWILFHGSMYSLAGLAGAAFIDGIGKNMRDPMTNVERAKALAAEAPDAKAVQLEFGGPKLEGPKPAPPGFQPPSGPAPEGNLPPGFPPPPTAPAPAAAPAVNHLMLGELSAFFHDTDINDIQPGQHAQAYQNLTQRFADHLKQVRDFLQNKDNPDYKGPKFSDDQVKATKELKDKLTRAKAAENDRLAKTDQKNQEKYQRDLAKYQEKLKAEQVKVAQQKIENAALQKTEEEQRVAAAEAKRKEEVAAILADERVAHGPVLKALDKPLEITGVANHTSEQTHGHEHGHIMAFTYAGLDPYEFITDQHPEAKKIDAAAAVRADVGMAQSGAMGYMQRVVGLLGGLAFDEVHSKITPGRNPGAREDIRVARGYIRDQLGLTGDNLNAVYDALYEQAKKAVSNPEAHALVKANIGLREQGLHPNYHMSAGRMQEYVNKLKGVYDNAKTPAPFDGGERPAGGGSRRGAGAADTGAATRERPGGDRTPGAGQAERKAASETGKVAGGAGTEAGRGLKRRSTGSPEADTAIEAAGAIPAGGMGNLALFHDPETGSTLAYSVEDITPEAVKKELAESRAKFAEAEAKKKTETAPASKMSPEERQRELLAGTRSSMQELTGEAPKAKESAAPKAKASAQLLAETRPAIQKLTGEIETAPIAKAANEFNRDEGRGEIVPGTTHSPAIAERIGAAYEAMKHEPNKPEVKAAYDSMKRDLDKQWDYAVNKMGMKFEPWKKEGQPYANSKEMVKDVQDNKHLYFFQGGELPADHPMAQVDPKTGFSYNDKLRAVHDLFGHAAHGYQFGAKGEENAWNVHRQMFSPESIPAITTETRGQNSWVNYGPHLKVEGRLPAKGEKGYIPPAERPYAQNKAGILPAEFHTPNETETAPAVKTEAEPTISNRLVETFGTTNNPHDAGFILNDGRMVPLRGEHNTMMETLYNKYGDIGMNEAERTAFINNEKAVRTRLRTGKGGNEVVFSVPKSGVSPEQIEQIKKSVGQLRNGNAVMEISESGGKSTKKEFARVSDVEPMLQEIGAMPKAWHETAATRFEREPAGGINPRTGGSATEGKGSEMFPEARMELSRPPTAEDFRKFYQQNKSLFDANPELQVGWDTRPDGTYELNVGGVGPGAETVARKLDQRAAFDIGKGQEIPTGGTGTKTQFPEYPLEQRLKDLRTAPETETAAVVKGDRVSTRLPGGKATTEDPVKEALVTNVKALEKSPELADKIAAKVRNYDGVKVPANIRDSAKIIDRVVEHFADNLRWIYNQIPEETRQAHKMWYDSANRLAGKAADQYGMLKRQAAGAIAALSPQKDWDMNVSLFQRLADIHHTKGDVRMTPEMEAKGPELAAKSKEITKILGNIQGKTYSELTDPMEKAAWARIYDEAHNPRNFRKIDPETGEPGEVRMTKTGKPNEAAWGSLNEIAKSIRIMTDGSRENIHNNLGEAHKVRNFYNNIIEPSNPNDVTIDTHAVAAAHMQPFGGKDPEVENNFGGAGSAKASGIQGSYPLYADAYRKVAKEVGLLPRQLQSIVWEWGRNQFESFKTAEGKKFAQDQWQAAKDGKITVNQAREAIRDAAQKAKKAASPVPQRMSALEFLKMMGNPMAGRVQGELFGGSK